MLALAAGCHPQSTADAGTPRVCVGGIILEDGGCVAKCDATKCLPNNTCVNNACALKCSSHLSCDVSTQRCLPAVEDFTDAGVTVCTAFDMRQIGAPCSAGECGPGMMCQSTGPGDATEYCTRACLTDNDCPGGFECGTRRDPHKICGTNKGNNGFCGRTTEPCIDGGMPPEASLFEGAICLEQRLCLKRSACSPCTTSVDCSLVDQQCVSVSGQMRCAPTCSVDTDCEADKSCIGGSCKPTYGACIGHAFCSPCKYDSDCEPDFECVGLHGNEKSCIDMRFSIACTSDNDCPFAESGRRGHCLNQANGLQPGDFAYHKCYAPFDPDTSSFSCYNPKDAG